MPLFELSYAYREEWQTKGTTKCGRPNSFAFAINVKFVCIPVVCLSPAELHDRCRHQPASTSATWEEDKTQITDLLLQTEQSFPSRTSVLRNATGTHVCGMVVLKMSSMQLHVLSQVSGVNFSPFRITTFSKQLVPDLASCSLSAK